MGCFKKFKFWRKRDVRANLEKRIKLQEKLEEEAKQEATIRTLQEKLEELEEKLQAEYSKEAIICSLEEKLNQLQQKVDEDKDATICNLDYMECEKEQEELPSRFLSRELKRQ
jgi:small-conductance mechanosensitive channel